MPDSQDWSETVSDVAEYAQLFGQGAAIAVIQDMIRSQVTRLLQSYGEDDIEEYILVGTPIVREKAPRGFRNALQNVGPQFYEQIQTLVTPSNIIMWLITADEWLDEEDVARYTDGAMDKTHEELQKELQGIAVTIEDTPGGNEWLQQQCRDIYLLASGTDIVSHSDA
jgi:hypothetical protein